MSHRKEHKERKGPRYLARRSLPPLNQFKVACADIVCEIGAALQHREQADLTICTHGCRSRNEDLEDAADALRLAAHEAILLARSVNPEPRPAAAATGGKSPRPAAAATEKGNK